MAARVDPKPSSCSARIAWVGQACGRNETEYYFVGDAGELADRCFLEAGFRQRLGITPITPGQYYAYKSRRQPLPPNCCVTSKWRGKGEIYQLTRVEDNGIYITNVIKEQPPNNNIKVFIDLDRKEPWISPEAERYIEDLRLELEAFRGKINVLVPTGNEALYVLTGILGKWDSRTKSRGSAITNYWNSILESTLCPGMKVIPCVHPAAALPDRNPHYRYWIVRALQRIKEEARTPEIRTPNRLLSINPSFEQVTRYLEAVIESKLAVAFDIETAQPETITCISFSTSSDHAICIPFTDESFTRMWRPDQETEIWRLIKLVLEDSEIRKIAHNAAYEFQWLLRTKGIRTVNLDDTMIMQKIAFPDGDSKGGPYMPASLGFCCAWWTREPYYKEDDDAFLAGDTGIETYWRYNDRDSAVLHDIEKALLAELERIGNLDAYRKTVALLPILGEMEFVGINTDIPQMQHERDKGEREWQQLFGKLQEEIPVAPIPKKDFTIITVNGERVDGSLDKSLLRKDGSPSVMKLRKKFGKDAVESHKSERIFKDYQTGPSKFRIWGVDTRIDPTFQASNDQKKRFFYEFEDYRWIGGRLKRVKSVYKPYMSRDRDKSDKRRIDEYAMRKLAQKGAPGAATINEMAKIRKLISDYYNLAKIDADGRLHARTYIGPKTGRLASSENYWGTARSIQNAPQGFKRLLIADD